MEIKLVLEDISDWYWVRDQIGIGRDQIGIGRDQIGIGREIRLVLGGRLEGDQIGVGREIRLVLEEKKNLKIFSLLKIFEPAITVFCEQQGYTPSEILQKTVIVYA